MDRGGVGLATDPGVPAAETGWRARLVLGFAPRAARTVLATSQRQGPLTVQRAFYPEGGPCHVYALHPPGGVVGGDRLEIDLNVAAGAHALLTTPGAAKYYRSAGALAEQVQRLRVAAGGVLEWVPQEGILFPGARLGQRTRVVLEGNARFIGWEVLSLGRPVIGECFTTGTLDQRLVIERDGRPLLSERLRIADGKGTDGPTSLRGFPISATLVASGAVRADLEAARGVLADDPGFPCAMTLIDDLLVARALATRVEPVTTAFRRLWTGLRPRLLGRDAVAPRIWAT